MEYVLDKFSTNSVGIPERNTILQTTKYFILLTMDNMFVFKAGAQKVAQEESGDSKDSSETTTTSVSPENLTSKAQSGALLSKKRAVKEHEKNPLSPEDQAFIDSTTETFGKIALGGMYQSNMAGSEVRRDRSSDIPNVIDSSGEEWKVVLINSAGDQASSSSKSGKYTNQRKTYAERHY